MKYFMSIVPIFFILTGCATSPPKFKYGSDDHQFLVKEYENLSPKVNFILLKNEQEYDSARKRTLGIHWDTISAFTLWVPETGECTIYIKDPEWNWEPELIGHEVAHCIWGRYHKGRQGLKK